MKHVKCVHRGQPARFVELLMDLTGLSENDMRLVITMGGAYLGKSRLKNPHQRVRAGQEISAY